MFPGHVRADGLVGLLGELVQVSEVHGLVDSDHVELLHLSKKRSTVVREVYMPVLNTRCRRDLSEAAWSCCSFTDSVVVFWLM